MNKKLVSIVLLIVGLAAVLSIPTLTARIQSEWYDDCPGPPVCPTPYPIQPTYTPRPLPTCIPWPTCPPNPSPTAYPTATAYPTQPSGPVPTDMPDPTDTPSPTDTPLAPTNTPASTSTPVPTDTATPQPTATLQPTTGQIYYVATTGDNGNPGTEAQPFRTVAHAVQALNAGDTLYIREGTYSEELTIRASGTSDQPITIASYPDEHAVIDGYNNLPGDYHDILITIIGNYVTLDGLEIQNVDGIGMQMRGDYGIVRNMKIHHCTNKGILIGGTGYCDGGITQTGNIVEDNEVWMTSLIHEGINYGGHWAGAISVARCPQHTIVRRNVVHETWGIGIQAYEAYNTTFEDNVVWNNQLEHYYVNNAPYTLVQRNLAYNTPDSIFLFKDRPGTAFAFCDEKAAPVTSGVVMINNLSLGGNRGFYFFNQQSGSGLKQFLIANNTFVNSHITGIQIASGSHENSRIYNNVFLEEGTAAIVPNDPDLDFSHNLWAEAPPAAASSPHDVIADPHLAQSGSTGPGLLDPDWFRLLSDSPAVDAGITLSQVPYDFNGVPRSLGAGYDIGAYEHTGLPYPTPTPTSAPVPTPTSTPSPTPIPGEAIIADHTAADEFPNIPSDVLTQIQDLDIYYGRTSHGMQVEYGALAFGNLNFYTRSDDLGHEGNTAWVNPTRNYLDAHPETNVVMWSWCGGAGDNTEGGIDVYLDAMNQLEQDYPDVTFVYMTGHLNGTGPNGNLRQRNNQIRTYCQTNNKALFDFADIESYDPDGNFYPQDNDTCDWCYDWCNAHPADCNSMPSNCPHSHRFNCKRKGQAFWWLLAQLLPTPQPTPTPTPTPGLALAFPGAEGFGANSVGGRGGRVIEVTNLNDSGSGSLRACIEANGPRTCIFRTGGTIELQSGLDITNPFITIAGQTAPGGGIALKNSSSTETPLVIKTHNVIIRYLRIRPGAGGEPDGIVAYNRSGVHDVIIDHCSVSWSVDENLSTYQRNITIQWSIISEGLYNSTHEKGHHSCGILVGDNCKNISIHHNLFAHNHRRSPFVKGGTESEIVNNVVYNWGSCCGTSFSSDNGEDFFSNVIGNYYVAGEDSKEGDAVEIHDYSGHGPDSRIYVRGNIGPSRPLDTMDEWAIVNDNGNTHCRSLDPVIAPSGVTTHSAVEAYELVLQQAGATLPARDLVDQRIINDVRNSTGRIIDHPSEVGGWPELAAGTAPVDTDHDGMPDVWENLYAFNPCDPSDGPADADGDGYTNVEEYLNGTNPL